MYKNIVHKPLRQSFNLTKFNEKISVSLDVSRSVKFNWITSSAVPSAVPLQVILMQKPEKKT